jgi:hypothetical protein
MSMRLSLLTLAIAGLLVHLPVAADTLTYNGHLEAGGAPASGRYDLRLVTHGDAKFGAPLATPIEFPAVAVTDGAFRVEFEMPPGRDEAWVELAVRAAGDSVWSPIPGRTKATAAPSAIGQCWSSTGDDGSNPALNFLGTTDAQPLVMRTRNVQSLRLEPSSVLSSGNPITANVIGGSSANSVTAGVRGATIAGGGTAAADPDFFSTAAPNRVFDHYGVVGGGVANAAGTVGGTLLDGAFATVSGGVTNGASGLASSVGGGLGNLASERNARVGGGRDNTASGPNSVVAGGTENTAIGSSSAVSGGIRNCAGGSSSWAGGADAKSRPGTVAGAVGSGCAGVASSGDADGDEGTFIWADSQNTDFVSIGPNQFLIRAQGGMAINTNTPAAGAALTVNGNVAVATTGSLSFGSQTRQMLNLWGPAGYGIGVQSDRLYFRSFSGFSWFQGGVHSDTADNAGTGGTLRMRLSNTGQLQTTTGTISTLSDARLKDQIADYSGALGRINALRPVTYHYRDAGKAAFQPEGTHLGFIAQEVQQVFPQWVSEGDDGHLMLSMRGFEAVAVRAIQELSAENDAVRAENAELRARLDRIEQLLGAKD